MATRHKKGTLKRLSFRWNLMQIGNLASGPPILYAVLYFATLLAFAFPYAAHAEEFYSATTHLEQGHLLSRATTREALFQHLSRAMTGVGQKMLIDAKAADNRLLAVDGQVSIGFVAVGESSGAGQGRSHTRVEISVKPRTQIVGKDEAVVLQVHGAIFADQPVDERLPGVDLLSFVRSGYPQAREGPDRVVFADVPLPEDLSGQIQRLAGGHEGLPVAAHGLFLRMLYFSTATITTLGFGDIVPISERMRHLVMIESLLGIVLMGLFLNALAVKASRKQVDAWEV